MEILIIGGGIAGLSTAYFLEQIASDAKVEVQIRILERTERLGGKICTVHDRGFLMEGGPDSFLVQKPWAAELCRELGLADELVPANTEEKQVYQLRNGQLVPYPDGFRIAVPSAWGPFLRSPLLSWRGKARVALERMVKRRPGLEDESVSSFLRRRIGREAAETLAEPLMSGIHAADPEQLSIRTTWPQLVEMERTSGSLLRGTAEREEARSKDGSRAMFESLRGGVGALVDALRGRIQGEILTGASAGPVRKDGDRFEVDGRAADAVVVATPAFEAATLLRTISAPLSADLDAMRYVSTASVSLGYRAEDVRRELDAYGFIVPASEGRPITACTWVSTKFAGRAPQDHVTLRAFMGRDGQEPDLARTDAELNRTVCSELSEILGIEAEPVAARVFRWPRGNPQYDVGHLDRVARIEDQAESIPGLFLTGSAYWGGSVPDCIFQAMVTAEKVLVGQG
jgi:oxygen-dependent protoporphyrinogen oxidase